MSVDADVLPVVPASVSVLAPFVEARVFGAAEVHLATTVVRVASTVVPLDGGAPSSARSVAADGPISDEVILALAVAARGPRLGHVCIELSQVERLVVDRDDEAVTDLPWPALSHWIEELGRSDIVAAPGEEHVEPIRPLVWDGRRLYLHRYWSYEAAVARDLATRAGGAAPAGPAGVDQSARRARIFGALESLFGPVQLPSTGSAEPEPNLQRRAAEVALGSGLAVIVGGPGTGKTRTVARLLAAAKLVAEGEHRPLDVALAAPTGKAAARMTEAVHLAVDSAVAEGLVSPALAEDLRTTTATTIHGLLGWAPGAGFRHDRNDPLPHDLVVVDETSMVALPLMARLLDAVRPDAQLVLVGDPYQLASVEAGTVLGDVVGPTASTGPAPHEAASGAAAPDGAAGAGSSAPLAANIAVLRRAHRFAEDSAIARLAEAVRVGNADAALEVLDAGGTDVRWVRDDDAAGVADVEHQVVDAGVASVTAALAGFGGAGLEAAGRVKVLAATRHQRFGVFDWSDRIEAAVAARVPELTQTRRWYVGRPVIITANDPLNRVANGDVGLVVNGEDGMAVALSAGEGLRLVPPSRLDRVDTWWAMTIHKSQGSEFPHAVVSLPAGDSPVLTRELIYTAVTRAQRQLTVVSSESSLRAAIARPVARASGLRDRLWPST
ncbi:MAG: exodeoxyribonuclease V subunit alpha [Actinomycetota bacterium]|nr:exodeoxyribonuclease V subunit alpha [Actinomycetota bacterium]